MDKWRLGLADSPSIHNDDLSIDPIRFRLGQEPNSIGNVVWCAILPSGVSSFATLFMVSIF